MIHLKSLMIFTLLLVGCVGVPDGIDPVENFQTERYLGTWYEIARLDHKFERGLSNVTASYSVKENGSIRVINRGYKAKNEAWSEAEGKAKFVETEDVGHLKVSFFGPFYASYVIFDLDADYQHAFITGNDKDYLWLLSRTPTITDRLKNKFLTDVTALGFDTNELIWVDQSKENLE